MPELAEVEHFRKRWDQAACGATVTRVLMHERARVFRGVDCAQLRAAIENRRLQSSLAAAKQMLFRFGREVWLGLHLGMTGELAAESPRYEVQPHDHLVLLTRRHALVFRDPRMFGRVQLHRGDAPPSWWTKIAPAILSKEFTAEAVAAFLQRRARAPVKAVLLMQERFPGVGNWMADEILWRAAIHPRQPAGSLAPDQIAALWRECRRVCRLALATIAGQGDHLPSEPNAGIPNTWLMPHRWEDGGLCPRTRQPLERAEIGGRMTCWSPARQMLHGAETPTRSPRRKVTR